MLFDTIARGAFLDAIGETVPIILADLETGEIVYATRPAEELFGRQIRGELIGTNVDQLVPESVRLRHKDHRANYAKHPLPRPMGAGLKLAGVRADGTEFPVEIALASAVVGLRKCAIAVVMDMSGRYVHNLEDVRAVEKAVEGGKT